MSILSRRAVAVLVHRDVHHHDGAANETTLVNTIVDSHGVDEPRVHAAIRDEVTANRLVRVTDREGITRLHQPAHATEAA